MICKKRVNVHPRLKSSPRGCPQQHKRNYKYDRSDQIRRWPKKQRAVTIKRTNIHASLQCQGTASPQLDQCPNWEFVWKKRTHLKEQLPTKQNLIKKSDSPHCGMWSVRRYIQRKQLAIYAYTAHSQNHSRRRSASNQSYSLRQDCLSCITKSFFLVCFWEFWNHRHDIVFRNTPTSIPSVLRRCIEDASFWAKRLCV